MRAPSTSVHARTTRLLITLSEQAGRCMHTHMCVYGHMQAAHERHGVPTGPVLAHKRLCGCSSWLVHRSSIYCMQWRDKGAEVKWPQKGFPFGGCMRAHPIPALLAAMARAHACAGSAWLWPAASSHPLSTSSLLHAFLVTPSSLVATMHDGHTHVCAWVCALPCGHACMPTVAPAQPYPCTQDSNLLSRPYEG